jgi:hypothetical protein
MPCARPAQPMMTTSASTPIFLSIVVLRSRKDRRLQRPRCGSLEIHARE